MTSTGRRRFMLFASLVVLLLLYVFFEKYVSIRFTSCSKKLEAKSDRTKTIGSTGTKFTGNKFRSFSKARFFGSDTDEARKIPSSRQLCLKETVKDLMHCSNWAVVTTIFQPSASIERMMSLGGWCLVIVGDKVTPKDTYKEIESQLENTVFLDVAKQKKMFADFSDRLPWNHFSRKNVGYLYAVSHGANLIFDFDDDNYVKLGKDPLSFISPPTDPIKIMSNSNDVLAFNPYPSLDVNHFSWPRGFPLTHIKNEATYDVEFAFKSLKPGEAGVFQSFADHDPDVDAIYRLTRPLPILLKDPPAMVTVSPGVFIPYNAQATLHTYETFWALLLPASVHGRVSDIWRSYFAQRLFRELDLHVIYTESLVTQNRNSHDYQADMEAEKALYSQTETLLSFLLDWDIHSSALEENIEMLWIALYERGYIEESDVFLIQGWLRALVCSGYEMPSLTTRDDAGLTPLVKKSIDNNEKYLHGGLSPPVKNPADNNERYLMLWHSWEPFTGGLRSFGHFLELASFLNRTAVVPNAIDGCIVSGVEERYGCGLVPRTNSPPHALSDYIDLDAWIGDKVKYITIDDFTRETQDISVGIEVTQKGRTFLKGPSDKTFESTHGKIRVAKEVQIDTTNTSLPEHILNEKSILFWRWPGIDRGYDFRTSLNKADLLDISHLVFKDKIVAEVDSFVKDYFDNESYAAVHLRFGKIAMNLLDNPNEYKEGLSCLVQKITRFLHDQNLSRLYLSHDIGSQPEYLGKMNANVVRDLRSIVQSLRQSFRVGSYNDAGNITDFVKKDGPGGFLSFIEIELMSRASNLLLIGCSSFGYYAHQRAIHQERGQVLERSFFHNCTDRLTVRKELLSKNC